MPQNPDQSHPSPRSHSPDPAHSYERAKPERESPQGTLHHGDGQQDPQPNAHPDRAGPESTSGRHTYRDAADSAEKSTSAQPAVNPGAVGHVMKDDKEGGA